MTPRESCGRGDGQQDSPDHLGNSRPRTAIPKRGAGRGSLKLGGLTRRKGDRDLMANRLRRGSTRPAQFQARQKRDALIRGRSADFIRPSGRVGAASKRRIHDRTRPCLPEGREALASRRASIHGTDNRSTPPALPPELTRSPNAYGKPEPLPPDSQPIAAFAGCLHRMRTPGRLFALRVCVARRVWKVLKPHFS